MIAIYHAGATVVTQPAISKTTLNLGKEFAISYLAPYLKTTFPYLLYSTDMVSMSKKITNYVIVDFRALNGPAKATRLATCWQFSKINLIVSARYVDNATASLCSFSGISTRGSSKASFRVQTTWRYFYVDGIFQTPISQFFSRGYAFEISKHAKKSPNSSRWLWDILSHKRLNLLNFENFRNHVNFPTFC